MVLSSRVGDNFPELANFPPIADARYPLLRGFAQLRKICGNTPSAFGKAFHRGRTAVSLSIDGDRMFDMEVGEWPRG